MGMRSAQTLTGQSRVKSTRGSKTASESYGGSLSIGPDNSLTLMRKTSCACGGGCPGCQAKSSDLKISQPNDPAEIEADQMADRVMRMQISETNQRKTTAKPTTLQVNTPAKIQGKCDACEEEDEMAETPAMRKEAFVSATPTPPPPNDAPSSIRNVINSGGRPLDLETRNFFEPRFGTDLSQVRLHTDSTASQSARSIDARAYTLGSNIVFDSNEYDPKSESGKHLLAHELAHVGQSAKHPQRLWRKPKGTVTMGEPEINSAETVAQKEEWVRLQVWATGMDHAAHLLAAGKITLKGKEKRNPVFIGLHPQFIKVYDQNGKSLGSRIKLKEVKGLTFQPGVYVQGPTGFVALTVASDDKSISAESGTSIVGQRALTAKEKEENAAEEKKAKAEGREPKPRQPAKVDITDLITEIDRFRKMAESVPDGLAIYFVPTYSGVGGKGGGESTSLYASPIEGRGDGQPANAPPWPVTMTGPKLVPVDSSPTFDAKIDWAANANYTLASQVISQVGETIHYKWERYDITKYAKEQIAKTTAGTKPDPNDKPRRTLNDRIEEFKTAKEGTGKDVTGTDAAKREFSREFEYWWKDTQRAKKGIKDPSGDTVGEKMSNSVANRLSLELAPISLLTTAVGATLRFIAELFAGPRKQQEVHMEKKGIFLTRVITTPAINEDTEGKPIIRPPSVAAKLTEVTPMERAVEESLDEPAAQLAELESQIKLAEAEGNQAKADYLKSLLAEARERFGGTPLTILIKKRDEKRKELVQFRENYPTLSDYSREREVEMLDDQINLYSRHERERTKGSSGLDPMKRVNATLISEITGEQYPLLISAGPMAKQGDKHQWMIIDVTNREGDAFTGLGDTPSAAFRSALDKFAGKAAYGRGKIGVSTEGLGLEPGVAAKIMVDSSPADWALAEKRIDDLVTTLALLGLVVASAGTAGALIGAGVAAARLIERWQAGKLYLDGQTVNDLLGVLGGIGAAGQLAAGLRVQKFDKMFAVTQEGKATEAQIAKAAEALTGAKNVFKAVEIANEAINYGGLMWGNIEFIDQIMTISAQESSGQITHAAARRARAMAIGSAVQNNGLFIAGNVLKAKAAEKGQAKTEGAGAKEKAPPREKAPVEGPEPQKDEVATDNVEPPPKDKSADESVAEKGDKPAQKAGDPLPIGERQATPAELKAALPPDLQKMMVMDDTLTGDTVKADYKIDPDTGLISEIKIRVSPDARPRTVELHVDTVRTMQKYQGFSGRVRQAVRWVGEIVGVETLSPDKNPNSFRAALEIRKLPTIIQEQMARMKNMESNARDMAEGELAKLQVQLDQHLRALDLTGGEASGSVAAEGLSKTKQKKYAELMQKLRGHDAGSDQHKTIRWEMYELVGGDLPYVTWEKIYDANVTRATKANESVVSEKERLGWGKTEQTVKVGKDDVRRLDIANVSGKKGVEVKAYETGKIYASEDIVWEVERDAKLVKAGWDIKWILIDTEPSGPLLDMLLKAGIIVEIRTKKGTGPSEFVSRNLPPKQ